VKKSKVTKVDMVEWMAKDEKDIIGTSARVAEEEFGLR